MDFYPNASMLLGMRCYVGVVHKDADSYFGVSFPDLPGCATVGRTMAIARQMAAEALAVHLDGFAEGDPFPVARTLTQIRDDPKWHDATTLILVDARTKSN
jgi:predicted RNase H-like HicB family nuclease